MIKVGSIVKYVGYNGGGSKTHGVVLSIKLHEYQVLWYNGLTSCVDKRFVDEVS